MKRLTLVGLGTTLLLMGCPPTGVVCKAGTVACGAGCIDPSADRRNCGFCGHTCAAQQDCNAGTCACRNGTTPCADGTCAVTAYDVRNCGACGNACQDGQVCESGQCQSSCSAGLLRCVSACVESSTDEANCGGCGVACAQGQQCRGGVCEYEAVAACYWSGQLVGFDPDTGVKGPLSDVGSNPGALARVGSTVLSADGTDRRLYSAIPTPTGEYFQTNQASQTGAVPNQVLVDRPYVYVVNSGAGTLLVLQEGATSGLLMLDAGVDAPLTLGVVTELSLGMNTFPQGLAKLGSHLWIPLYGGYGAVAAEAGQEVLKVDISDPTHPNLADRVSLKGLDLRPFDGGQPVARPFAICAHKGSLYVALNNMNPDSYAVEGPGLLAKIEPTQGTVSLIDLGAADCLNPQWVAPVGDGLAVSCGGRVTYDGATIESTTAAGVVALDGLDVRLPTVWNVSSTPCGADAGCMPLMPGRFSVLGQQLLVSDQNGGRVAVLEVSDAGVSEVRNLKLCPLNAVSGVSNVSDVLPW